MSALTDVEDEPRSRSRSRSRASVAGNSTMSLQETVERLMKDKAKYKSEIKKYKTGIRSRVADHRDELERNQEYFQEQIFALTDERDDLSDQVNSIQEKIFNEKERLRADFVKKISAEKKRIETRYGGKNSTRLQQLQTTVDKLQEKLAGQLEEKDRLREQHEALLTSKEDQSRFQLEQIEEQLRITRRSMDQEREDIRRASQVFQLEKDSALAVLRKEKNLELEGVVNDKSSVIRSLEFTLGNLQKDKDIMEREHTRELQDSGCTHELAMKERNKVIDRLKDTHARSVDQLHNKHESLMRSHQEKSQHDLAEAAESQRKALLMSDAHHTDVVNGLRVETMRQIQELGDEVGTHKQKSHETDRDCKMMMEKLQKNCDDRVSESEKTQFLERERLERDLQKSHQEDTTDRDNTIIELERLNHALGAQVGHYRSAMENMKTDTSRIKQQFIQSLNKQKEEDGKAVSERETRVKNLQVEVQNIHQRTTGQLNDARIKMSSLTQENTKLKNDKGSAESSTAEMRRRMEKLDLQRSTVAENYEKRIERMKSDFASKINSQSTTIISAYQQKIDEAERSASEATVRLKKIKSEVMSNMTIQRKELLEHNHQECQTLRAEVVKAQEKSTRLGTSVLDTRKQFTVKMNEITARERTVTTELQHKLDASEEENKRSHAIIKANRSQFSMQLNAMSGLSSPEKEELRNAKADIKDKKGQLNKLKTLCESLNKKINTVQAQTQIDAQRLAQEKAQFLSDKEALVKKANTPVRDTSIENKLKKMRDNCVEALRRQKIELNNLKQDNLKMKRQIVTFEADTKKKQSDLADSTSINTSLKNSYIVDLNAQKISSEKDMAAKEEMINKKQLRISELEQMLSDAVRKIMASK